MTPHFLMAPAVPEAQLRLLILCVLLLGATVVTQDRPAVAAPSEAWATVYLEPPAYLHPRTAIGFDLSGLPHSASDGVEAALLASARTAGNADARAHTHMSLAVYYKLHGQDSRAAAEKRKGDYWVRVSKIVEELAESH
jgi:hypothetical protein